MMSLWKSWREKRSAVLLGLGYISFLLIMVAIRAPLYWTGTVDLDVNATAQFSFHSIFIGLLAWMLGQYGLGHEIGNKTAAYTLTRPCHRWVFTWSDWLTGIFVLAAEIAIVAALFSLAVLGGAVRFGDPGMSNNNPSFRHIFGDFMLGAFCLFMFAALVFGLAYLSTIALRSSSRGLIASMGIFLLYHWGQTLLSGAESSFALPDWYLSPFVYTADASDAHLVNGLAVSLLCRLALIFVFPIIAQVLVNFIEV
jgi:ABC-type transport system involved in multi-copper enzyme maturation permease subunit